MVAPRWPRGPVPLLAVVGMAIGFSAAFFPAARLWPIIKQAHSVGTNVFRSDFGFQAVMGLAVVTHIAEAFVTIGTCVKNKVSPGHTLGWFVLVVLMGYPAMASLNSRLKQAK